MNREIEAGPISLVSFLNMGTGIRRVRDLCVGVKNKSESVLLFSTKPVEELNGESVSITSHTATSSQLLRILFKDKWGVEPTKYVGMDEASAASLVIGDPALSLARSEHSYPHVYDLALEWNRMTGLPFVFAVWGVHSDVGESEVEQFGEMLEATTNSGIKSVTSIASERANDSMAAQDILDYLSLFFYKLNRTEHEESIKLFGTLAKKLP